MRHLTAFVAGLAFIFSASTIAQDHPDHPDHPEHPEQPEQPDAAAKKETVLTIGDKAPAVKVAKYFKGTPVDTFKPGNVYVMEFWATWCGPCVAQIPHLTKMQKEHKKDNVQFMSTAVWQREKTQADREKKVGDFVAGKGDAMQYTIAIDNESYMADHWMKPAGQNGIPAAFLVGKTGEIEWIGHPGSLDGVLNQYLTGTWDRAAAKAKLDEEQRFAKKGRELMMKAMMAERSGDRAAAAAAFEELAKEFPNNENVMAMQFDFLLGDAATADQGYAIGRKLMTDNWDSPSMLNMLAWTVADDEKVAKRDLSFAMKAATRANELTKYEDASIVDTLARVYWEQGNKTKAIELQKKAIALAEDGRMKDNLKETLASYTAEE